MVKKIYTISGFDCPNCAAKAEMHINKDKNISYARLDFAANKMYITFKDEEYSIEKIKAIIKEVESDEITLKEFEADDSLKTPKIFTTKMWFALARVIFAGILSTLGFILSGENTVILRAILFSVGLISIIYDIIWQVINHIIHKENILDHNLLITISAIGAFILGFLNGAHAMDLFEGVMVVMLFQIGKIIENVATNKSKAAIMSAIQLRVEFANLVKRDEIIKVRPEELRVGDYIIIKTGELIPVDCKVIDGEAFVDTSSLTGEYVPVKVKQSDALCSGCLVKEGNVKASVSKIYEDSTVAKIIDLINNGGEKKSKADAFIAKFAKFYTPIVVAIAVIAFLIGGLITKDFSYWVKVGLEILVTGCPCAIIISVPLAYFSAIGLSSKNGIIVKGANYLDELNRLGKLLTDKTGTLTRGSFVISKIHSQNLDENEFMKYLYAAECLSNHPIGKAICHGKDLKKLASEQNYFQEVAGLGVETMYDDKIILAGSYQYMQQNEVECEKVNESGTVVYCAVDSVFVGYVVLADEIKDEAKTMVNLLHNDNVEIVLLTGDKEDNAKSLCNEVGIDRWHSELLPEDKVNILENEMEKYNKAVAFIGDGINDAPSIIRSDIGIAMGGIGSDIAVENADLVIMNDDPAKVYDAKRIAKMARNTSIFNITFALIVKFATMLLILLGVLPEAMMIIAVGADTGLTVLLVLNSLLLLYRKIKRK